MTAPMPLPAGPAGASRLRNVIVDVVVFLFVVSSAFLPDVRTHHASHSLIVLPFMVAAGAALFARRRFPVVVLGVCVLIGIASAFFGVHTQAFAVPIAIAMYSVARYRSRGLTVGIAVSLAVFLILEELVIAGAGFGATDVANPATLQPAVVVAFAAALGSAIRYYFDALSAARERARRAEETSEAQARRRVAEDRLSIARDLHDSVAHRIAVINLQAGVAARTLRSEPDEAEESIAVIGDAARTVLAELTDMLGLLRTSGDREVVDEPDFARIDGLLGIFARSGLTVDVRVTGEPRPLPPRASTIAYRVMQESLTNAYKHGAGHTADVRLDYSTKRFVIHVVNPVTEHKAAAGGHGLVGMRERLTSIGGTLELDTKDAAFVLTATLPLERAATASERPSGRRIDDPGRHRR